MGSVAIPSSGGGGGSSKVKNVLSISAYSNQTQGTTNTVAQNLVMASPQSAITNTSVTSSGTLMTQTVTILSDMKLHVEATGIHASTQVWHQSTPFFDVYLPRTNTHYTSGTYVPNANNVLSVDIDCKANDVLTIKKWYGNYQYGSTTSKMLLYS